MSEHGKDSPHGSGLYGSKGQRNLLGERMSEGGKKSSTPGDSGFFNEIKPPIVSNSKAEVKPSLSFDIKEYFKNGEIPDSVFIPSGVAYYRKFEDIPTESFRNRSGPPKIDTIEDRASVVLGIAPVAEGEDEFASFKYVGERGLYVRVIKEYDEITRNGVTVKLPVLRWVPFNSDEDVYAGKIRRV